MAVVEKVRYLLWAKSAGRCQFDNCNKIVYEEGVTKIEDNFGEVSHIIGDSPDGPRGDELLSIDPDYCNNISNLMLLCKVHHKLIDTLEADYDPDLLRLMKRLHEDRIRLATKVSPDKTSNIIIYRCRVGEFQPEINFRDASNAMREEGYYPADHKAIELSISGLIKSDEQNDFWDLQEHNLEEQVKIKLLPLFENEKTRNHYSIFAFAPIPLLIKLGSLIPNLYAAEVYQLKKEPPNWIWEDEPEDFSFKVVEPTKNHDLVAINLSLSADIEEKRIVDALGSSDVSIWTISIDETDFPKNDHLRSKAQLISFKRALSKLLNDIKTRHGQNQEIHIFPAIPVAYAVEMGRLRQAKADLPWIIYDQNNRNEGFHQAIRIE